jgi:hypothetical protein
MVPRPAGAHTGAASSAPPDDLPRAWIAALLPGLAGSDVGQARRALHAAAGAHFEALGMAVALEPFRDDVLAFLEFLRREWG